MTELCGDIDDRSPVKVWSADINGQARWSTDTSGKNNVSACRFKGDVTWDQEENLGQHAEDGHVDHVNGNLCPKSNFGDTEHSRHQPDLSGLPASTKWRRGWRRRAFEVPNQVVIIPRMVCTRGR